jgi:FKBP-type peptidyl-prolyl cis-trans isomerase FkpA
MRLSALLVSSLLSTSAMAAEGGPPPPPPRPGSAAPAAPAAAATPGTPAAPAIKFPATVKTDDEKTIYALGLTLGKNLVSFSLSKHEQDIFKQALTEAITNPSKTDAPAVMQSYSQKFKDLLVTRQKKKSEDFLAKAGKEKGAQTLPSGLIFTSITEGTGATPAATDKVKVNYKGTLADGTEFDSSYKRGQPAEFQLNQVVPCWTEGIQKMKVGGKAKLVCPSKIAYGDNGHPPVIPPAAALTFEVELLGTSPGAPTPPGGMSGGLPPQHPGGMPPGHP